MSAPRADWRCIEIPKRMRILPKDRRGYPVPFIVMRDKAGRPHFTINDHEAVAEVARKRLCGICGRRRDKLSWFVGGPACFLHAQGAFLDPPMHEECARYALRVCPYLAAPSYGRRIDEGTLRAGAMPDNMVLVADQTMPDARPEAFGIAPTEQVVVIGDNPMQMIFRADGWAAPPELWQNGQRVLDEVDLTDIAQRAMDKANGRVRARAAR